MSDAVESGLSRIFNPSNKIEMVEECMKISSSFLEKDGQNELRYRWELITDLFYGSFHGYQACNTEYHDFNHTCDVFCATVRMYDGAYSQGHILNKELLLDTCTAAMLHDVGYIQESNDTTGTGAKHTKTHVTRSIAFAAKHHEIFHLSQTSCLRVGRIISGTDLGIPFNSIPFEDTLERTAAELLASADLLGQMADRTYLEKLLFLYYEFREADFPGYDTEFDILRKTLGFYESTKIRLFETLNNASNYAYEHFESRYGVKKNLYMESIQRQIDYLQSIIDDDSANFRTKLKRLDLDEVSRTHIHLETHT